MQRFLDHFSKLELAIIACAFVIRLFLVSAATWYPISDTRDYHDFAYSLAHGQGYKQIYNGETHVFTGFTFYAFREPGYPIFLAILYSLLGWNPLWAYISNAIFDTITLICILLLAKRLFGSPVPVIAALVWAINVLWTPNLMTESLFTALFAVLLWLSISKFYFRSWRHAFVFGMVLAVAFFVRPIAVAILPVVLYHDWGKLRENSRAGLAILICLFAPLMITWAVWTVRNYMVLNAFVPLTTNFGSHNADSFGVDWVSEIPALRQQGFNEAQINNYLIQRIEATIAVQPIRAAEVFIQRPFDLFSLTPAWELSGLLWPNTFMGSNSTALIAQLYHDDYAIYYMTYPLFALGMLLALIRRAPISILLLTLVSFVVLQNLVSPGNVRFAAPLYPIMCLFAAYAVAAILEFLRSRLLKQS